jgi:DNA (cytosine-5)-methyltransferase 1
MQVDLFNGKPPSPKQSRKRGGGGARNAVSRYRKIKQELDGDKTGNGVWVEIDTRSELDAAPDVTFADLFSGAGGFSVGARQAGLEKIFSVEIDADASETIRSNFPKSIHFETPIELLAGDDIDAEVGGSSVNIVFGGPPCQGFSVAGLRDPDDPRNKLFHDYVRIVEHLQPDFVVMENVPGILTMEKGKVRREIVNKFADVGYPGMSVRILEAATFGVPQLRTRAIFVANKHGLPNPYPAEIFGRDDYATIEDAIDDLKSVERGGVPNHEGTRHSKKLIERIAQIPPGGSLYETFRDAYKRQYRGVPSMAVKENHGGCHVHYELNRVLTAREMARLQTFPDDFIFSGTFKRAYWQIGNAVPCLMAKHIALAVRAQYANVAP